MFSCRYLELFECNNVVGNWAYIWELIFGGGGGGYIRVGLYLGGLYLE